MKFLFHLGLIVSLSFGLAAADPEWFMTWEHPPGLVTQPEWGSQALRLSNNLRHQPQRIVIHHAGVAWKPGTDPVDKVRRLQAWGQREKSWPDLPYHYLIVGHRQAAPGQTSCPGDNLHRDWTPLVESRLRPI